jgi:choline dehydrogenase-like flavoprotein
VRLADSDPTSMPLINPNFVGDERDLKAAIEAVRAIREVMAQPSLVDVIEQEIDPGPNAQSDSEIGDWIKSAVTTMFHPVGTCRMGKDDRAVVDARLRVKGVGGLRVIDASIMPNITSGNTNAPTQALARHASAMLVEDLKQSGAPELLVA